MRRWELRFILLLLLTYSCLPPLSLGAQPAIITGQEVNQTVTAAPAAPAGTALPGNPSYPYPFYGMQMKDVLQFIEHFRQPPQVFHDEYVIVRDGREIPVFSARRGSTADSYEVFGRDDFTSLGRFQAQANGRVNSYSLGPDLVNALFRAGKLTAPQFAQKFARMHNIPRWEQKKSTARSAWEYNNYKQGYRVVIFDDKSLTVEPLP